MAGVFFFWCGQMAWVWLQTGMAALLVSGAAVAQQAPLARMDDGDQMQVGRYTTVRAEPAAEVGEPLQVMARIHFPKQTVRTVGDAVRHVLLRTGWQLASDGLSPQARHVLSLPLPESQRTLGPYRVRTILEVLLGSAWQWHEDPVQRTVWFTLAQGQAVQVHARSGAPEAAESGDASLPTSAQEAP